MIGELADEIIAAGDGGVAEEWVGAALNEALALDDALALVFRRASVCDVGCVGGFGLFFDLQEEGVAGTVALEINAVIAQGLQSRYRLL